jgi:hypothetical protein
MNKIIRGSALDPDPHGSVVGLADWIRIRNQENKNDPQKQNRKSEEISIFEVLDVLF